MTDCLSCATTWALLAAFCGLLYLFLTWNFGFWKKRGAKEAKAYPIIGSFPSVFTQKHHMTVDIDNIYRKYRDDETCVGVFTARKPQLLILSPELAHKIYVNDFKSFNDNEFSDFITEKSDKIFGANPFSSKGEKWKERRNEITPGLTPNRVKSAYPVTLKVCERYRTFVQQQSKMAGKEGIDTVDLSLRLTCEITTDCVLGVQANALNNDTAPILEMTKAIFGDSFKMISHQFIVGIFPFLQNIIKLNICPEKPEKYFFDLMSQSINLRKQHRNDRVDFLNYMLQLQEKKNYNNEKITINTMTFLVDGFFTTAATIAHCLLLLARHPTKQEKLREEINNNLEADETVSFEKLHELPYLDACYNEALRLFSPLLFANKLCTEPYEAENKNGSKVELKPGDVVMVPVHSLHLDEKYFKNPNDFLPERFLGADSVKKYRERGLLYGFGEGPRICPGMRFALTQAKAGIVETIRSFKITVNPKTRSDNRLDPKQFMATLDGGIWLDYEPLN